MSTDSQKPRELCGNHQHDTLGERVAGNRGMFLTSAEEVITTKMRMRDERALPEQRPIEWTVWPREVPRGVAMSLSAPRDADSLP